MGGEARARAGQATTGVHHSDVAAGGGKRSLQGPRNQPPGARGGGPGDSGPALGCVRKPAKRPGLSPAEEEPQGKEWKFWCKTQSKVHFSPLGSVPRLRLKAEARPGDHRRPGQRHASHILVCAHAHTSAHPTHSHVHAHSCAHPAHSRMRMCVHTPTHAHPARRSPAPLPLLTPSSVLGTFLPLVRTEEPPFLPCRARHSEPPLSPHLPTR